MLLVAFMLERIAIPWADWGMEDVSDAEKVAAIMEKQDFAVPEGFGACIARTGPGFFSRAVFRYWLEGSRERDVVVCPQETFYSKPNNWSGPFHPPDSALAVHHWGRTWQNLRGED